MSRTRKGVAALLCALLFVGLLPAAASAADIQEGTPAFTLNSTVVAFAGHEWYVIGNGTSGVSPQSGHLTLLARNSFGETQFRVGATTQDDPRWVYFNRYYYGGSFAVPSDYDSSAVMNILTDSADAIPANEAALITAHSLDDIGGTPVSGQKLWPLSLDEYYWMGGISGDPFTNSIEGLFWLRTPDNDTDPFLGYPGGGISTSIHVTLSRGSVRPALHLNLSPALFTSDANWASFKFSATVGGGLVGAEASTQILKFTIKNSEQTLVVLATTAQSTQSGASLLFSYAGATTGTNQYVSCVLLDELGAVKYYGKLADSSSVDRGILNVPLSGVSDGTYTLKIFSEQVNGDMHTDFASTPIAMKVAVSGGIGTVSGFGGTVLSDIADGQEIDLRVNATHIQWRYTWESDDWRDLIALAILAGADGGEIELRVGKTHIQWRYKDDAEWQNLIALSSLVGAEGPAGADGEDGREIELRNDGVVIQWRYAGENAWNDLVTLAALTGSAGTNGADGRDIELRVDEASGYIQWRYTSGVDTDWKNLMAVASLGSGPQGPRGEQGLPGGQGPQGAAGAAGSDGRDGRNGRDGSDGSDGRDGLNGKDGVDGANGANGINGKDGQDGADGRDGNGILSIAKTGSDGNVDTYTISFTDGISTTFTVTNGKDGAGVLSAAFNESGELVFTLTDGTQINLGQLPGGSVPTMGTVSGEKDGAGAAVPVAAGAASGAVAAGLLYWLLPLLKKRLLAKAGIE